MNHTITLTTEEEAFLKSILPMKFKINGVVPTIDKVLTTYVKNRIAQLKRETDKYVYSEKLKSKWDSLPDTVKQQVIKAIDTVEKEPDTIPLKETL